MQSPSSASSTSARSASLLILSTTRLIDHRPYQPYCQLGRAVSSVCCPLQCCAAHDQLWPKASYVDGAPSTHARNARSWAKALCLIALMGDGIAVSLATSLEVGPIILVSMFVPTL